MTQDLHQRRDEQTAPTRSIDLTFNEARILYDEIGDLCDSTADGGSIPPQAWRTAFNKLSKFVSEWDLEGGRDALP